MLKVSEILQENREIIESVNNTSIIETVSSDDPASVSEDLNVIADKEDSIPIEHSGVHNNDNDNDDENSAELNIEDAPTFVILGSVRCAAHTLQLAIYDVIKTNAIALKVSKVRFVVKKFRTTEYR